jgi:hypothetical protein
VGSDEERLAQQLAAELEKLRVEDVLLQTVVTVASVGYRSLGLTPETAERRDLEQTRLAVDALQAVIPLLERVAPAELVRDLRASLAGLQLAFAQAATASPGVSDAARGAEGAAGGGAQGEGDAARGAEGPAVSGAGVGAEGAAGQGAAAGPAADAEGERAAGQGADAGSRADAKATAGETGQRKGPSAARETEAAVGAGAPGVAAEGAGAGEDTDDERPEGEDRPAG